MELLALSWCIKRLSSSIHVKVRNRFEYCSIESKPPSLFSRIFEPIASILLVMDGTLKNWRTTAWLTHATPHARRP